MQVQRAIEMAGIPTVLIATDPANAAAMRPPRTLHPEGFRWGHSLGRADNEKLQHEVLQAALSLLTELHTPGEIVSRPFTGYGLIAAAGQQV